MNRILLVGCGFLGKAAAFLFRDAGWQVHLVTNSEQSAGSLRGEGWDAHAADVGSRESLEFLRSKIPRPDTWLHCASTRGGSPADYERVYLHGVRNLLFTFPDARPLFTSSTSVYGQGDGSLVTEQSPCEPPAETARILLDAENAVLGHGGCVARLAGIYGSGRSVLLKKFLTGEARIEAGGMRWINQIHRDDAAEAWAFLAKNSALSGIFNVCDNTPMRQRELYAEMARRLAKPMPPESEATGPRKRGQTNKRVSNAKLRGMGWAPRHPDFFSDWENLVRAAVA